MIQLITPPGMLLTVALLVIYSVYAFLIGSIEQSWPLVIGGLVAVAASYGAAMVRPWSRYLIYLLTIGFLAKLGNSIFSAAQAGFFSFQFDSMRAIVRSLMPSALMALLSLACCLIVFMQFRRAPNPAPGAAE